MDFERLKDIWNEQPDATPRRTDEEWTRLIVARDRTLRRQVRRRDFIELGVTCTMAIGFAWQSVAAPVGWPWAAAAAVLAAPAVVFVRERLRRSARAEVGGGLRDRLVQALAETDHQARLLESMATWYLLPIAVVIVLTVVGSVLGRRARMDPAAWTGAWPLLLVTVTVTLVVGVVVLGIVWWLNRLALRRHLWPQREALVRSLHQLDAAEDAGGDQR